MLPLRLETENMMDNLDFSEEEIQDQLAALGYTNIPKHRLREFKQDLDELVRRGEWKSLTSSAQPSPPPYTKEKVSQRCFQGSAGGFFLHARKADHDRQATTGQSRECGRPQDSFDSYARHSVALNLRLPPGAPSRLQVVEVEVEPEPDPDDTLHPPLSDGYTSTPDSQRERFIKRKVLRKHKGQSLVCDESVYSEDSALRLHRSQHLSSSASRANMYKMNGTQWDDDKTSLNSSFWSDGERQEDEEEKVEIERVIGEEDFKPVDDAEDSYPQASEEEEEVEIGKEESKPVGDTDESYPQASEEEEEVEIGEEESKLVGDAEDSYPEEEEEEIGQMIGEEDAKSMDDAEDSYQDASDEEEEEEEETGEEDSKPLEDSEDSYQEASEDEAEEIEQVSGEEDAKPVDYSEDSYQEASEVEEEKVEIERVNSEEEAKPGADSEHFYPEASEEEEEEIGDEDSKPVDDSEDSYQEASEEEEEEIGHVIDEEDSKPVGNAEDSYQEASEEEEEEIDEEESKSVGDVENSYQEDSSEKEEVEIGDEDSKPVDDSEDSYQEASEEEEEEIDEEESKSVGDAENSYKEASEEEKPEQNNQINISDEDDEECRSSSSDSPAPSLMTSGYGTYRPEEQEGGDYRDDHTITEFDQDSRGDLSEMRDDEEDDRSLCSFGGFDIELTESRYIETRPLSALADAEPEADVQKEVDITDMKPEEDKVQAENKWDVTQFEDGSDHEEEKQNERLEEEAQHLKEEKEEESADRDESSSNKDIKFIDSKVDFSGTTFNKMCEEWEGNLRQKKDSASCLEERLADLQLSSPARRDLETGNEDVSSQSDTQSSDAEGVSFSAFESYLRGMTRSQSDGDLRPKPKSFIRPVRSQQTIKKTDPVAKYFRYKQLWEMFKLPGETDRRALRWEIKERLAFQPPPPKPRRVYVPNTYIVPTEKKRSALRWEIRNDLANRLLPYKYSY